MKAADMKKAMTLGDVIGSFNGKVPLDFTTENWKDFYVDTGQIAYKFMYQRFLRNPVGFKFLFGGHSGNGKSTELNRFKADKRMNAKYQIIACDAADGLEIMSIQVVDLLLFLVLEAMAYVDAHDLEIDPYLEKKFALLEGFFEKTTSITTMHQDSETQTSEAKAEARVSLSHAFASFKGIFTRKVKAESAYRSLIRETFQPKIAELTDLLDKLVMEIHNQDKGDRPVLFVVDGLDRMLVPVARKFFIEDGPILGNVRACSMLLTVPISIIHSPEAAEIQATLGPLQVFPNLALRERNGEPSDKTRENRERLRQIVHTRMDEKLISEQALKLAIDFSGGVLRTLVDLISEAAVFAEIYETKQIDDGSMKDAISQISVNKERPLSRAEWLTLHDIQRTKKLSEGDENRLKMLQGLYALEYVNGETWYDLNPLLEKAHKSFLKAEDIRNSP